MRLVKKKKIDEDKTVTYQKILIKHRRKTNT